MSETFLGFLQGEDPITFQVRTLFLPKAKCECARRQKRMCTRKTRWIRAHITLYCSDQKYCCVSKLNKVTIGSCAGGAATRGGYKYASTGLGDIPAGVLDTKTLSKTKPIVRQFDDNFKYQSPAYDYTIYICGTEEDSSSSCCKCF